MGEPFRISHAAKQLAALLRKMKKPQSIGAFSFCGGGEIRTHGTLASNGSFQDCCLKPLGHSSNFTYKGHASRKKALFQGGGQASGRLFIPAMIHS
jgi:hypothetical protein